MGLKPYTEMRSHFENSYVKPQCLNNLNSARLNIKLKKKNKKMLLLGYRTPI